MQSDVADSQHSAGHSTALSWPMPWRPAHRVPSTDRWSHDRRALRAACSWHQPWTRGGASITTAGAAGCALRREPPPVDRSSPCHATRLSSRSATRCTTVPVVLPRAGSRANWSRSRWRSVEPGSAVVDAVARVAPPAHGGRGRADSGSAAITPTASPRLCSQQL